MNGGDTQTRGRLWHSQPGQAFFFFLSLCEKKGEKNPKKQVQSFSFERSPSLCPARWSPALFAPTHMEVQARNSAFWGFFWNPGVGNASVHVEFAGVDLEDFVLFLLLTLPVPGLVHKIRSSDFRRSAAPRNNLECACSGHHYDNDD